MTREIILGHIALAESLCAPQMTQQGATMEIVTPLEAAAALKLSVSTLNRLRMAGGGPVYRKYGRLVRYDLADLIEWSKNQARSNTSEHAAA